MKVYAKDPTCYLVSPSEIDTEQCQIDRDDLRALKEVVLWAHDVLCTHDPELGRDGPVCPFTKPSLARMLFWLTVCRSKCRSIDELVSVVMKYREWFLELEPQTGENAKYKTILILLPDFVGKRFYAELDRAQKLLKAEFVREALMIGQFYPTCGEPGLWNSEFRPLRSTVPMLVIRHMVHSDFPFLRNNPEFVDAYLRIFGVRSI